LKRHHIGRALVISIPRFSVQAAEISGCSFILLLQSQHNHHSIRFLPAVQMTDFLRELKINFYKINFSHKVKDTWEKAQRFSA
jgi:hypothetical protein